jgi:PHD/YefM family antitoxin component YafN of YafNO toxin-antitoxin module
MEMRSLTAAEIKSRGMAAIEEGLKHGPVQLMKRNRVAGVVVSAQEYARLRPLARSASDGLTAVEWLLRRPAGNKGRRELDRALKRDRATWT